MSERLKMTAAEEASFTKVFVRSPRRVVSEEAENEYLCSHLLGWKQISRSPDDGSAVWDSGYSSWMTPTFTTWHDAGLILEALNRIETVSPSLAECLGRLGDALRTGRITPTAIRAAALSYLRSLER